MRLYLLAAILCIVFAFGCGTTAQVTTSPSGEGELEAGEEGVRPSSPLTSVEKGLPGSCDSSNIYLPQSDDGTCVLELINPCSASSNKMPHSFVAGVLSFPNWVFDDNPPKDERVLAIFDSLQARNNYSYGSKPYYYKSGTLTMHVYFVIPPDAPWGFKHPDYQSLDQVFNGHNLIPELGVRDYYLEQSYGRMDLHFDITRKEFALPPDETFFDPVFLPKWMPGSEEVITGDQKKIAGDVAEPLIFITDTGNHRGGFAEEILWFKSEGDLDNRLFATATISLHEWNDEEMQSQQFDYYKVGYDGGNPPMLVVNHHEIGHMMNFPDTYNFRARYGDDYRDLNNFDLMGGAGMAILGLHKVIAGWTCFIAVNHNVNAFSIKPQDVADHPREIYYLKNNSNRPGEFYYMENLRNGGILPGVQASWGNNEAVGLFIGHAAFDVTDHTERPNQPFIQCASQGWATKEYTALGNDQLPQMFPWEGPEFSPTSEIPAVWYGGESAELSVKSINYVDNKHYRPYLPNSVDYYPSVGYGDIICDVDVGSRLYGDFNGDGIVNAGDALMLKANMGRRVGVDPLAAPLDVNGDGKIGLARDRDGDGFVATSERIYDDNWTLLHTTGDWLDTNGDGKNDLDEDGDGRYDQIAREMNAQGIVPGRGVYVSGSAIGNLLLSGLAASSSGGLGGVAIPGAAYGAGDLMVNSGSNGGDGNETIGLAGTGPGSGSPRLAKGSEVPGIGPLLDANDDGIIDFFDADGDGMSDKVPAMLDPNGDGIVNELDAAYLGYYWGETTFEELWIPLPAPDWN